MLYCEKCKTAFDADLCPVCGKRKNAREVRDDDPCLLTEKNMIWSEVLEDTLKEHGIPYMTKGRMGAALAFTIGPVLENMIFYVPYARLAEAKDLVTGIFSEGEIRDEDSGEE